MSPKLNFRQLLELLATLGAIIHLTFYIMDNNWRYPYEILVFTSLCVLLIALFVFNPASFARRVIRRLAHLFEIDPFISWFVERDSARPDMQKVWKKYAYLGFIGLSQVSLTTYLRQVISSGKSLPWESIDIFFASDKVGEIYEGAAFASNIRQNRQLIAAELTDPANTGQLEHLKEIRFLQMDTVGAEYTGSVYGQSRENPEVFYVVLLSPGPFRETKKALTFRVDRDGTEVWNPAHRAVLEHYQLGFSRIHTHSLSLGAFRPSIWDQSAAEWSSFCEHSALMSQEMSGLIEFAGQVKGKDVLDLGCGSGEMSKLLLRKGVLRLVALDQSPQMLRLAKQQLGYVPNIKYALCRVPTKDREDLDFEGQQFHMIVLHQVLPAMASDKASLTTLAQWCLPYLKPGGVVALAAHDSIVELDHLIWGDPFRVQLRALFELNPQMVNKLKPSGPKLRTDDITSAFIEAGFRLDKFEIRTLHNTMADRARMWNVPVVLDSFVDVNSVGLREARVLSHKAAQIVQGNHTKDRTVGYWLFSKP